MKKKSTLWIAIILVLIVAFFLKVGFSKSSDKDDKEMQKQKKNEK